MLKKMRYPLCILLAIFMFSTFEVASKSMHGRITATQLTFFRFLIGGIILLPFGIRDLKRNKVKFTPKLFFMMLAMGFMLVTISMNLCQIGLQMSSANIVAVLFSSNPLFISLFSALILHEKLTVNKIIGLLIGLGGVVVTCGNIIANPASVGGSFIFGIVLVIIAMLVFSVYTVLNKKLSIILGSCGNLSMNSILGALTLIPIALFNGASAGVNPFAFAFSEVWPQFLYISIFVTGIAYYFYYDSLAHTDTSIGSMSFFIKPPLASILAAIFLNEKFTINIAVGIVLIIIGVAVSTKFKPGSITGKKKIAKDVGAVKE